MKKFDLSLLVKNLSAVFCGIFYVSLLLPFAKVGLGASEAHILVNDYSTTFKGIQLLTDGSVLGIILIVLPLVILLATYLPQLAQYKKIACLISSVAVIFLVITCSFNLDTVEVNLGEGYSIETHRLIGFWIMLICGFALTAISVVPFIKGEPTAQAAAADGDTAAEAVQPSFDSEKIADAAKNFAGTIKEQGKSIASKLSEQAKNVADNVANHSSQKARDEKPEEIMEQLKKLNQLKEDGILTDEEFAAKKAEMLDRM